MSQNHRHKRHFQSSISAYFPSLPRSHSDNSTFDTDSRRSFVPSVPEQIQSSLINVGMRVRKAVPEGYKRKEMYENTPFKVEGVDAYGMQHPGELTVTHKPVLARASSGLMPFCGIHKIGGFDVQDTWTETSGSNQDYNSRHTTNSLIPATCFALTDDEEVPFFSSQLSIASTISTDSAPVIQPLTLALRGKKRQIIEDEEEEFMDGLNSEMAEAAGLISTYQDVSAPRSSAHRVLATARRVNCRGKKPFSQTAQQAPNPTLDPFDFNEVDFLDMPSDAGEDMDLDAI